MCGLYICYLATLSRTLCVTYHVNFWHNSDTAFLGILHNALYVFLGVYITSAIHNICTVFCQLGYSFESQRKALRIGNMPMENLSLKVTKSIKSIKLPNHFTHIHLVVRHSVQSAKYISYGKVVT